VDLTGLDAAKNGANIYTRERCGFIGYEHQYLCAALITPSDQFGDVTPNRRSLARLEGDDCCFFLASHRWAGNPFPLLSPLIKSSTP
jgi:hypothetical protein